MDDDPQRPYLPTGRCALPLTITAVCNLTALGSLAYAVLTFSGCNASGETRKQETTLYSLPSSTNKGYTDTLFIERR